MRRCRRGRLSPTCSPAAPTSRVLPPDRPPRTRPPSRARGAAAPPGRARGGEEAGGHRDSRRAGPGGDRGPLPPGPPPRSRTAPPPPSPRGGGGGDVKLGRGRTGTRRERQRLGEVPCPQEA